MKLKLQFFLNIKTKIYLQRNCSQILFKAKQCLIDRIT